MVPKLEKQASFISAEAGRRNHHHDLSKTALARIRREVEMADLQNKKLKTSGSVRETENRSPVPKTTSRTVRKPGETKDSSSSCEMTKSKCVGKEDQQKLLRRLKVSL